MKIAGVALVTRSKEGKLLILLQRPSRSVGRGGQYGLPGGAIEHSIGESASVAARRELREESGLELTNGSGTLLGAVVTGGAVNFIVGVPSMMKWKSSGSGSDEVEDFGEPPGFVRDACFGHAWVDLSVACSDSKFSRHQKTLCQIRKSLGS